MRSRGASCSAFRLQVSRLPTYYEALERLVRADLRNGGMILGVAPPAGHAFHSTLILEVTLLRHRHTRGGLDRESPRDQDSDDEALSRELVRMLNGSWFDRSETLRLGQSQAPTVGDLAAPRKHHRFVNPASAFVSRTLSNFRLLGPHGFCLLVGCCRPSRTIALNRAAAVARSCRWQLPALLPC